MEATEQKKTPLDPGKTFVVGLPEHPSGADPLTLSSHMNYHLAAVVNLAWAADAAPENVELLELAKKHLEKAIRMRVQAKARKISDGVSAWGDAVKAYAVDCTEGAGVKVIWSKWIEVGKRADTAPTAGTTTADSPVVQSVLVACEPKAAKPKRKTKAKPKAKAKRAKAVAR
jgi:hypothetical protein